MKSAVKPANCPVWSNFLLWAHLWKYSEILTFPGSVDLPDSVIRSTVSLRLFEDWIKSQHAARACVNPILKSADSFPSEKEKQTQRFATKTKGNFTLTHHCANSSFF